MRTMQALASWRDIYMSDLTSLYPLLFFSPTCNVQVSLRGLYRFTCLSRKMNGPTSWSLNPADPWAWQRWPELVSPVCPAPGLRHAFPRTPNLHTPFFRRAGRRAVRTFSTTFLFACNSSVHVVRFAVRIQSLPVNYLAIFGSG